MAFFNIISCISYKIYNIYHMFKRPKNNICSVAFLYCYSNNYYTLLEKELLNLLS